MHTLVRSCRWIAANRLQRIPLQKPITRIEPEDACRDGTDLRERLDSDAVSIESEVLRPVVIARVEEAGELPALRCDGAEIAALAPVAEQTGEGKVIRFRRPAMFLADDVIDLAAEEGIVLVDEAVLAQSLRPPYHQPPEFRADVAATHR